MTAITITDLNNAKLDVDHIANVATSLELTATDRLGHIKSTLSAAVDSIKSFNNRGAWASTTVYAVKDLVSVLSGGVTTWYVCVVAHTSSAAFTTDTASKWRVYQGVIAGDLAASSGASLVGYMPAGVGAVATTVQGELRKSKKASNFPSIQSAVDYCVINNFDLEVDAVFELSASINIDRIVDSPTMSQYFTMFSNNGGGFVIGTSMSMFSTSLTYVNDPVTQLVHFNNLWFKANSGAYTSGYVLDGSKFLRSKFSSCTFDHIKLLTTTKYIQSIYVFSCNIRKWAGCFFDGKGTNYDVRFLGNCIEAGTGSFGYHANALSVSYTDNLIEGISGTAITYGGAKGLSVVGNYFEGNGVDIDGYTLGGTSTGVALVSNFFNNTTAVGALYSVLWGACTGAVSLGNFAYANLHKLIALSVVQINDASQTGNVSSTLDAVPNKGYRQATLPALTIRTPNSVSYTVSDQIGAYTINGNKCSVQFSATLTSTGTNTPEKLYISAGLPGIALYLDALGGNLEVVGSTLNSGISPMYISSLNTVRLISSLAVLPSNVSGDTWKVRGNFEYLIA